MKGNVYHNGSMDFGIDVPKDFIKLKFSEKIVDIATLSHHIIIASGDNLYFYGYGFDKHPKINFDITKADPSFQTKMKFTITYPMKGIKFIAYDGINLKVFTDDKIWTFENNKVPTNIEFKEKIETVTTYNIDEDLYMTGFYIIKTETDIYIHRGEHSYDRLKFGYSYGDNQLVKFEI